MQERIRPCERETAQGWLNRKNAFLSPLQRLKRYIRLNRRNKTKQEEASYCFRIMCAPDKAKKSVRYEFGLRTKDRSKALYRAAELVALLHFCGWVVYSKDIDAPALACLFPLSDLSDDLGTDRDDEEASGFYGGNAGFPFLICWPYDSLPR